MKLYEADDKMIDLISDNYSMLQGLSAFGIRLGFGDKTVSEICSEQKVDCYTFLMVVNFLINGYAPKGTDDKISVKTLLDTKKLNHTECVMYRTVSNDFTEEEAKEFDYDLCVFFSPSGINAFQTTFGDTKNDSVRVATFGPSTTRAAHEAGLNVVIEAPSAKYPSMTGALKAYLDTTNP